MARAWKGHLSFGLVSIPLQLYPAARKENIQLHQIHKKCNTRIRQPLFCPTCNRIVQRSEIIKGYEYEKGQYVYLEDHEVKKIAPGSERTMEIQEFVMLSEVDPVYFQMSYLAVPDVAGRKAYALLLRVLEETGRAALAKLSMQQREYLTIIRPHHHGLTVHTMYYANEIREVAEYGREDHVELKAQEIKLAKQLVESLAAPFRPEKYHDEYQQSLKELIDSKQKGHAVANPAKPKLVPVLDMMEALKKSVSASQAGAKPRRGSADSEGKRRKKAS